MFGIKDSKIIYIIKDYRAKIIREDIQALNEIRRSMNIFQWEEYISKYRSSFVSQNKMLFELVIKDYLYPDYSSDEEIENISFIASKKTLDFIINKIQKINTSFNT
ncbi:MAG: hypothetical protein KA885_03680 [Spirochaetes bacterium]|nr:hypothetical protein [Spirochaetota bacterium]